jgi:hypothetical protein
MQRASRELAENLEKYGDKSMDVLGSFLCGSYSLSKIGVRKSDADPAFLSFI